MSIEVKTVVFDMDGTALNDKKEMDAVFIKISPKLQEKGIQLIIASGRLDFMVYDYLNQPQINHAPIIACNGGKIGYRDETEPIFAARFPLELTEKLIAKAEELDILYHVFTTRGLLGKVHAGRLAYYSDSNASKSVEDQVPVFVGVEYFTEDWLKDTVKILIVSNKPEVAEFKQFAEELDLEVVFSGDGLLDITLKDITKGSALQTLAAKGIIDLETTMAFGDNYNDVSMLEVVKYPIVMENGEPDVKAIAYDICGINNEHGLGKYLANLFEIEFE